MTLSQKVEKVSNILFSIASVVSKLQIVPLALLSSLCRFLALGIYFFAYGTWFTATALGLNDTEYEKTRDKWYRITQIKKFLLSAAVTGFIATMIKTAAIILSILFLPAAWLYFIGNLIWTLAEFCKLKNHVDTFQNFSYTKQSSQLSYAITVTLISLLNAISVTLIFFFPPLMIPVTIGTIIIGLGLSTVSTSFLLDVHAKNHKPLAGPEPNSHAKIRNTLGPSSESSPFLEPIHAPFLFEQDSSSKRDQEKNPGIGTKPPERLNNASMMPN